MYVYPSAVLKIFEEFEATEAVADTFRVNAANEPLLSAALSALDHIPDHLLKFDGLQFANFVRCKAMVASAHENFLEGRRSAPNNPQHVRFHSQPFRDLMAMIATLPDQGASASTPSLSFLKDDAGFQSSLRLDISAADDALRTGQWKAATVLAGSVIEALLLWAVGAASVDDRNGAITRAMAVVAPKFTREELEIVEVRRLARKPKDEVLRWEFRDALVVSYHLGILGPDPTGIEIAVLVNHARNYRNLIHAGREMRMSQKCDRSTALTAAGALERLISTMERKHDAHM